MLVRDINVAVVNIIESGKFAGVFPFGLDTVCFDVGFLVKS